MKKLWHKIPETVRIGIKIFFVVIPIWIMVVLLIRPFFKETFGEGLLIEAFGMLLDIIVFGIVIIWLYEIRDKKRSIRQYTEELDILKPWKSEEAGHRAAVIIKRLNELGVTRIWLHDYFMKGANLREANLGRASLQRANLREADLWKANLREADLWGVNLREATLWGVDLRGANLREANLGRADLDVANLWGADLRRADLGGADLWGADLGEAYLGEAYLKGAYLEGANLGRADLRGADLEGAYLWGVNLGGAKNLTIEQLSKVETLYGVLGLDADLGDEIKNNHPHLFEKPKEVAEGTRPKRSRPSTNDK